MSPLGRVLLPNALAAFISQIWLYHKLIFLLVSYPTPIMLRTLQNRDSIFLVSWGAYTKPISLSIIKRNVLTYSMFINRREIVLDTVDPAHIHWSQQVALHPPFSLKNYSYLGPFNVTSIIKSFPTIFYLSLCNIPLAFCVPLCVLT